MNFAHWRNVNQVEFTILSVKVKVLFKKDYYEPSCVLPQMRVLNSQASMWVLCKDTAFKSN